MIEHAIEKLRLAMIAADHETLRELTFPELSYGHTSGLIEDQDTFIAAIGERDHFNVIKISDLTIRQVGEIAIVRHRFEAEVLIHGTLATPDIRVLQVWQKEGQAWKLLARQAYKV